MSEIIYVQVNDKKRKATEAEIAQITKDQEQASLLEAEQQAKEAARQSAMDKLAKLGLTDEEISALVL